MFRLALVLAVSACAEPRPAPSLQNVGTTPTIVVRLMTLGEKLHTSPKPPSPSTDDCPYEGEPADQYYEPVVAFARQHLTRNLDPDVPLDDVHPYLLRRDAKRPELPHGIGIEVTPLSAIGSLRVRSPDVENVYCLHVLHDGNVTTIVIDMVLQLKQLGASDVHRLHQEVEHLGAPRRKLAVVDAEAVALGRRHAVR